MRILQLSLKLAKTALTTAVLTQLAWYAMGAVLVILLFGLCASFFW
jgi:hypothetical protein